MALCLVGTMIGVGVFGGPSAGGGRGRSGRGRHAHRARGAGVLHLDAHLPRASGLHGVAMAASPKAGSAAPQRWWPGRGVYGAQCLVAFGSRRGWLCAVW